MGGLRFGTSGVRGVFNRGLDVKDTGRIGSALNEVADPGVIGVGYDTRACSKVLAEALTSTLNYYGRDVVDLGVVPTPLVAFATRELGLVNGVSVTASHNPPEYSGIKIFDDGGMEVDREVEQRIEEGYDEGKRRGGGGEGYGRVLTNRAVHLKYIDEMVSRLEPSERRLKVLVDCGNGATAYWTCRALSLLGHRVVSLNAHQSSQFPGRILEPNVETLKDTSNLMARIGFDLGIAHDGDGDRVVAMDEQGSVIPDQALTSLALKIIMMERRGGGVVVLSVNTSNSVEEVAEAEGCKVVRARLGKTFIELKRVKGVFASEPSKVTDPRWGLWEDGVYAACLLAQKMSRNGKKLSEIVRELPLYFTYQRNLSAEGVSGEVLARMILKHYRGRGEVEELDGLKIKMADGSWILFRMSGTEPKVRVYTDSRSEERALELLQEGVRLSESVKSKAEERVR